MVKLGTTGKQWLKGFHILVCLLLFGGGACMLLLRLVSLLWSGEDPHGLDRAGLLIQDWVVIPAAVGALVTGFLESRFTTWGFVKYRWVMVKWAVTGAQVILGSLFLGSWAREMESISAVQGPLALSDPEYASVQLLYVSLLAAQTAALAMLPFISVMKPWMKKRAEERRATQEPAPAV